jgi:hypothetical protein
MTRTAQGKVTIIRAERTEEGRKKMKQRNIYPFRKRCVALQEATGKSLQRAK